MTHDQAALVMLLLLLAALPTWMQGEVPQPVPLTHPPSGIVLRYSGAEGQ